MMPCEERMPASSVASSAASGKKYMSLKQVMPPRSISAQAARVPSRTNSAEAERIDLRAIRAFRHKVGAHRVGALFREPLVVLRGTEAVGVAVHDDVADLAEVLELAHHFGIELALRLVGERRLVELEQFGRREIHYRRLLGLGCRGGLDFLPRHWRRRGRG